MHTSSLPVVALTLGDPAGIGAELIARLLARPDATALANLVLIGDRWLWQDGQRIAGLRVDTDEVPSFAAVRARSDTQRPAFLPIDSIDPAQVHRGRAEAAGGRSVLQVLDRCMDATLAGEVDAICFAPLNKQAMKIGGMQHEDELHHFAAYLGVAGYFCEFNTLGELWTSRLSSHVPMKDVARYITAADYVRALDGRRTLKRQVDSALEGVDALLLPTLPIVAPPIGAATVEVGSSREPVRNVMLRLTQLFNLTGHPAISIPCGETRDGLPCGIQLVGRHKQTPELLQASLSCEAFVTPRVLSSSWRQ